MALLAGGGAKGGYFWPSGPILGHLGPGFTGFAVGGLGISGEFPVDFARFLEDFAVDDLGISGEFLVDFLWMA